MDIIKPVLCVVLAFFLTATVVLSLQLLSARVDNARVTTSIRDDLRSGAVAFPPLWDRDLRTGIDTWTDCLVLSIATFGQKDLISAVTRSNFLKYSGTDTNTHVCEHLDAELGGTPIQGETEVSDYWRYWWGSAALLNIAIGVGDLTLPTYQTALKALTYAAIFLMVCTALVRYRRAAWPLLPVAVALTFGFAIPLFGQSIADAPGLIIGIMLATVYMAAGVDRAALRWQFVYFFVAGGIGFYFDLLNGDLLASLILFALLRLLSTVVFGPPKILWPALLARLPTTAAVGHTMAGYVAGAVSMAIFRVALRAFLTGQGLFAVLSEWHAELSKFASRNWPESQRHLFQQLPVDPSAYTTPLIRVFRHTYYDLEVATFPYIGRYGTVFIYALCALLYVAIGIWWLSRRGKMESAQSDRLLAASLISVVVPLWYCLFPVHTIIHFWMMGRLLALFFALAPSIVLIININEQPRRAPL